MQTLQIDFNAPSVLSNNPHLPPPPISIPNFRSRRQTDRQGDEVDAAGPHTLSKSSHSIRIQNTPQPRMGAGERQQQSSHVQVIAPYTLCVYYGSVWLPAGCTTTSPPLSALLAVEHPRPGPTAYRRGEDDTGQTERGEGRIRKGSSN